MSIKKFPLEADGAAVSREAVSYTHLVLGLPAEGETLDAETANKELADCYSRVMGADKWRRYVRLYRPDGTEEKF